MDFAFSKVLVIAAVALMVVSPKDLPRAARALGRWVGKAMAMRDRIAQDFHRASGPFGEAHGEARSLFGQIHEGFDATSRVGQPLMMGHPAAAPSARAAKRQGSLDAAARSQRAVARKAPRARVSKFTPRVRAGMRPG